MVFGVTFSEMRLACDGLETVSDLLAVSLRPSRKSAWRALWSGAHQFPRVSRWLEDVSRLETHGRRRRLLKRVSVKEKGLRRQGDTSNLSPIFVFLSLLRLLSC